MFFPDSPEAEIELGKSLNPNAIREGSDVYFDCIVNAQPPVYKVEWRHNVSSYYLFVHLSKTIVGLFYPIKQIFKIEAVEGSVIFLLLAHMR